MADVSMPAEAESLPDPGDSLIERVAGTADRTWFYWSGRESVRELERTLAVADRSLDSFQAILDFGCGCGRMLLWMEEISAGATLYGTDIDGEAITWCTQHIPYATTTVNGADPPLPYPVAAFDLVVNHSVFTHVDEARQDAWLTELQRVTRPGGLLVLSVHGEVALAGGPAPIRRRVEQDGIAFVSDAHSPEFALPDWYQATYHAPWYIFEHWGRWFEILAYLPGAALGLQDHVLLRRPPAGETPRTVLTARPLGRRAGGANDRLTTALDSARAKRGLAGSASARFGASGRLGRRLLLRALRPYTAHEDEFDAEVAAAVDRLEHVAANQGRRLEALERPVDDPHSSSR